MKVVILEDEQIAANHLSKILQKVNPNIEVIAQLDSVKNGIIWFMKNQAPDVVFMDIQLGDGLSFEILDVVEVECPIIFTTAFDEYALKAFKVNSIDYILKPVEEMDVSKAFEKVQTLTNGSHRDKDKLQKMSEMLESNYKERFIVKVGDHIHSIQSQDIYSFTSEHKATFAQHKNGRKYLIDYSLDRLEGMLDPTRFFRISRKYIIAYDGIEDIIQYSNSRLRIKLIDSDDQEVIVSRERVSEFRSWLDK